MPKGLKGFQKGNKEWNNPKTRKTRFKKGQRPWNADIGDKNNISSVYHIAHNWIRRHFGSAKKCENINCKNQSKTFNWALIHGKSHQKNRKNYIELCRKCHHQYDKISLKMWKKRKQ